MKLKKIFITTIFINLGCFLIYKTTHTLFEILIIIMTLSWGFFVFSLISSIIKSFISRKEIEKNITYEKEIIDEKNNINETEKVVQQLETDKENL